MQRAVRNSDLIARRKRVRKAPLAVTRIEGSALVEYLCAAAAICNASQPEDVGRFRFEVSST
jgi:hypothetical protein